MASPSSRAGYPNRQLTTIPTHPPSFSASFPLSFSPSDARAISPRFQAKPQLSSVFVIKRNHLGAKSRLPISLATEASQSATEISRLFSYRDLYRLQSPRQFAAGYPWLLASSGTLSIILDTQYVNHFAHGDRLSPGSGKTLRRGKRKVGQWTRRRVRRIDFHFRLSEN